MQMSCSMFAERASRRWFWLLFILALSGTLSGKALAAPTVTANSPLSGAINFPTSGSITAAFSDPMEPATITSGSITLSKPLRIKGVAAGYNYTLALRDNGTVAGWGYNDYGQIIAPAGLSNITAIATGSNHSIALKNDGTVVAWGDNGSGQVTVPAGLADVTAIAAGGSFTLALKADRTVVAWGDNTYGQRTIPGGLAEVTGISASASHALALKSNGTVVAWGLNSSGQTTVPPGLSGVKAIVAGFYHSLALKTDGTVVAWGLNNKGQSTVPVGLSGVVAIAAGLDYSMALKNDGTVVAWGDNTYGQSDVPVGLSGIAAIVAGYYHSVALKNDGTVASWGGNTCSQITPQVGLSGVTSVAAGNGHSVALKNDGTLFSWGYNSSGQAVVPAGLSKVSTVAAGLTHTLSLDSSGVVTAWGSNFSGETTVPTDLGGAIAITAGSNHSVAVKNDGTVVAWGSNSAGQTTVPAGLAGVTRIVAGSDHTLALKQDGAVAGWGHNGFGQITAPAGLSGVIAIAAGGNHSLALKSDGTVTAWGDNLQGQSTVPTGLANVSAIAAGKLHSVVLKDDGTVVAWGASDLGQSAVPAGLDRVVAIAAGDNFTLAVKNDGTLVGWGHNIYGQATAPQDPYAQPVASTTSYSTGSDTVTLIPDAALPEATTLTATVNTGVRSLDGTHPAADYSWSFTTSDPTTPVTTASPAGGTYASALNVTLTANEPATIYYTTNGATPTAASAVYSGQIPISATTTLKFFARDTAGNSEAVKSAAYTINLDTTPPVTTASPAGGTYSSVQNVTLTANEPATIYYTTNGATPTAASAVYSGQIPISVTTTLKFFAKDTAGNSETVKSAAYTINLDTTPPVTTASPAGGTYSSLQNVTLTANEPATIYYTTNGSSPTIASPVYAGSIAIPATSLLKFFARDTAGNSETVRTESYTIKQNQTITFDTLPPKTYGEPAFALTAIASSGLAVTYTSSNSAVATVSGSTVTIVGAGSATITASQGGNANYNPATAVARTLTVTKAVLVVQAANASRAYGAANPDFSVTYSGFVNGDNPAALSGSVGLATAAIATSPVGTYPITATAGTLAAANYSFSFVNGTLTVTKAEQTITFGILPAKTYGEPTFTLGATASSSLPLSYSSSNPAVATVSGNTVTIVGAGSADITASQAGNGNYNPAVAAVQSLTVARAALTVQAANATRVYGLANPAFSATYSGFINGDNEAVLSGAAGLDTVATAASPTGTYPITVTAGTLSAANYSFSFVSGTLTVIKAEQTISFGALPAKAYGDAAFTLTATASSNLAVTYSSSNPAVATVSGNTVTVIGAGSVTITASQGGNGNYNPAVAAVQALTVAKAALTVQAGNASREYGLANPAFSATFSGFVNGDSEAVLSGTAALSTVATPTSPVGSYPVIAAAGTLAAANYSFTFVNGTLTVIKAAQAITFDVLPTKTYGDATSTLNAIASSGLPVSYTSSNSAVATVTGSTLTIVGAGTAVITANQAGNGNFNAAAAVPRTLTVNKAVATLLFGQLTFTYDGNPKPVTVTTVPAGLTVTLTYDGLATAPTDVGNYTIVATVNDANYQGSATATEEIAKKSQTITFGPLPVKTYGDAAFLFSASASSNLNLTFTYDPAIATITKQGQKYLLTIVGAGTTVVTATQPGNRNYSDAPPVSQTLTVNKAAATVTLGSLSATYDGSAKTATATTSPASLAVTFTYDGSATAPIAAGNYSVIGTINNANYQGSATGTLAIARTGQTITFDPLSARAFGSAPFTPNANASSGLTLSYTSSNPAVATISGTTVTIVGVGSTTINASQGGNGNYTAAIAVAQTLTVFKGTATVSLNALNANYNGTPRAVTVTTVPGGLAVTLTYNGSTTAPTAVGTYTVLANVTDANYEGSATATLTVAKGVQTITFDTLSAKTYGDIPFNLLATAGSGLPVSYSSSNPAVATISGTNVTIVGAGTTIITASQGGDSNYNAATATPQSLTINKGTATVTLGNLSATYNGTPRSATAITVPGGLPLTITYNGLAAAPTAAGTYSVLATVSSLNYQGSTTGTLVIAKGAQTISFGPLQPKTVGNSPFTLSATSTSGLAISYTSSNPAVATISGTTVTIVAAGTTTITAIQTGDGNYDAAAAAPQSLTVNAAQQATGKTAVTINAITSYFDTVTAALAAVPAGSTTTIKLQTLTFAEAVNLNISGATISFLCGYDSGFTSASGMTTIQGNLVITAGALVADRLVIM